MIRILRAAGRTAVPWKNGGGVTRDVAIWPPGASLDDFGWRISLAEVEAEGPFSLFADIDRVLTILQGEIELDFAAATIGLSPDSDPLAFAGDVPCFGRPLNGPVSDLNVMVRRGRYRADVARCSGAFSVAATTVLVATSPCHAHSGGDSVALQPLDAIALDEPAEIALDGRAIRATIIPL